MKWHSHAKAAFYAMKGCLELWVMARKSGDNNLMIALTRILYDQVFSSGKPNQTGYISSAAMTNKREKKKTCSDHCLSPQFVARMVFDNPDVWLSDYEKFKRLFFLCCQTITVTPQENTALSHLTTNKGGKFEVKVPTDKKYEYLKIVLFHPERGIVPNPFGELLPKELLEYEKQYLVK